MFKLACKLNKVDSSMLSLFRLGRDYSKITKTKIIIAITLFLTIKYVGEMRYKHKCDHCIFIIYLFDSNQLYCKHFCHVGGRVVNVKIKLN